jgi:hypothetical protein
MAQKPSSKLKMIEGFISGHFDLRYNTISNMVEYKGKSDRDFSPLNESNIYRLMHLNDIKVSLQQISILLNSDFVPRYNPITNYFKRIGPLWDNTVHGDYIAYLGFLLLLKEKRIR